MRIMQTPIVAMSQLTLNMIFLQLTAIVGNGKGNDSKHSNLK